jgi:phospholipid methyltransferase
VQTIGSMLLLVGVAATVWAARVIGPDAYHYRDLFTGTRDARLQDAGPYALCHDPMYALGPLAGYGLAMLALSPMALVAAGVNQALLFVFNKTIELPRLWRSNWSFLETERRYDIACSPMGFDPRPELTRLRASDAPVRPVVDDNHDAAF